MAEVSVPKKCIAGVCVNEGPDFKLQVEEVDILEPGTTTLRSYLLLVFV
jgi:propanol-preferring alcohol dehydrogenase